MSQKEVTLALAAFLDSDAARALSPTPQADLREVCTRCLRASFEFLGTKPALLEGHELERLLTEGLPGYFRAKDPLAELVPGFLGAMLKHLEESEVVPHLFEWRMLMDDALASCVAKIHSGEGTGIHLPQQETVVHRASKLGRNDPCFCGSGRKFKKCHGKP